MLHVENSAQLLNTTIQEEPPFTDVNTGTQGAEMTH